MPWAIKKVLENPALRGRPSHGYLAAREARHQRRQEYLRTQAPLNKTANQTDLDTNSTQTMVQHLRPHQLPRLQLKIRLWLLQLRLL